MLHMVDTDISSYIIKRHPMKMKSRLSEIEPEELCISAITRAELMYGLERLPPEHHLQLGVRQFLKNVNVLAWDAEAADHYADIRHQLRGAGEIIGDFDMMIAAHALSVGAVLVTNNLRHFKRIKAPLMLANWA